MIKRFNKNFISNMDSELKYGKMVIDMKVTGEMDKLMVKENLYIQTKMFIMVILSRIGQMVLEFTFIKMVKDMKANGKMMSRKDKAKKFLKMGLYMKAILKMEKSGVKELINGLINLHIQENGLIII